VALESLIPADWLAGNTVIVGTVASLAAGLATAVGALPMLFLRRLSERTEDTLLGFAAGVMLAASFFSLIIPGLDHVQQNGGTTMSAAGMMVAAILSGAAVLWLVNRFTPHEHFLLGQHREFRGKLRRIWLFIFAITLHNFPEGLAVGVGFGGGDVQNGVTLAVAIGLQNMPEGLAVAASLLALDYTRAQAIGVALLSGLVEPVGGLIGAGVVTLSEPLLPWALGFAAGAMLFVVSNEIIPETHRKGHESLATGGVMVGLVLMMFLDVSLG